MGRTLAGASLRGPAVVAALVALPAALLAGVLTFWLLGGFAARPRPAATGPVEVAAPASPSPRVAAACRALVDALPDTLDGRHRRPVTGGAGQVAAWGDPPVVLRCGVDRPTAWTPGAQILGVNGVDWVTDETDGQTVWTTVSRAVFVEVRVPAAAAEESGQHIIAPLTGPVTATTPPTDRPG